MRPEDSRGVIVRTKRERSTCAVSGEGGRESRAHLSDSARVDVETDTTLRRALVEQHGAMPKVGLDVHPMRGHQVDDLLVDASASLATRIAVSGVRCRVHTGQYHRRRRGCQGRSPARWGAITPYGAFHTRR